MMVAAGFNRVSAKLAAAPGFVSLVAEASYFTTATARNGPPLPPLIFIGSAIT